MSTAETARAIADPANDVGGRFMLDGATCASVAANRDPARRVMGAGDAAAASMACGHEWGPTATTNQLVARTLAVLDDAEQATLVDLLTGAA